MNEVQFRAHRKNEIVLYRVEQIISKPDGSRERVRGFLFGGVRSSPQREVEDTPKPELRAGVPFPFVIAIIPAHNEEESLQKTIDGLRSQTRRPDEIIVLADNCTDTTIELAESLHVSVVETKNNKDGKAGGLNALLDTFLPLLDENDCILVMDADTVLTPRFIEATTLKLFSPSKKPIAGVGGIFVADDAPWNLVRQFQDNEYTRYQRHLARRHGRALVLTGTGTLFRVGVLRAVVEARRAGRLPDLGESREVYDTSALTEDNELTISVKSLGYRVVSPKDCTVKTAMMPTWRSLFRQRIRWQRGALENLIAHGINRHTFPYSARQVLTYLGVFFFPFYFYTLSIALVTGSKIDFLVPFWIAVEVVYIFEQLIAVRKAGWRGMLLSLSILPEMLYDLFLDIVYVISLMGALFATNESWGRMRNLENPIHQKSKKELAAATRLARKNKDSLHGTHVVRKRPLARVFQVLLFCLIFGIFCSGVLLPIFNLQVSWYLIAIYVTAGFVATVGRLVPVKTA